MKVLVVGLSMGTMLATMGCGVSSSKMRREDTTRVYSASYETVFDAGIQIVREQGWTLESASKDVGFITASSGMSWKTNAGQTVSIQFTKAGDSQVEVFVSARMNQSGIQIIGWGESAAFVRKVIAAFDSRFGRQQHSESRP